jgi:peroxiredoxin
MRYFFGLLASAALLFASGELSGRRAPGFSLPDLRLAQHDLQDYRGKIVILDIIQTTCPHCAKLTDLLEKLHAKYGEKVAVLSITLPPDTQATVAKFAAEHKVTAPLLFDCGQVSVSYLKATPQNPKAKARFATTSATHSTPGIFSKGTAWMWRSTAYWLGRLPQRRRNRRK